MCILLPDNEGSFFYILYLNIYTRISELCRVIQADSDILVESTNRNGANVFSVKKPANIFMFVFFCLKTLLLSGYSLSF